MSVKNVYIQLPQELWDRIEEARWLIRAETKTQTVRKLLEIALDTLEAKGKKKSVRIMTDAEDRQYETKARAALWRAKNSKL
jgi:hypothetical protein